MKQGVREFVLVAGPKVMSGVLVIAVNALLLRFLGPSDFGIFSLCVTIIIIADGALGAAFDMGVLRLAPLHMAREPRRAFAIEQVALVLKLLLVLMVASCLCLFSNDVARWLFHQENSGHLLYLTCLGATGSLLLRSVLTHLQVARRFMDYGVLDLAQSLLKIVLISFALMWLRPTPAVLLAAVAVAPLLVFLWGAWREGILSARQNLGYRGALDEFIPVVKWFLVTFGFSALLSRVDIFLLTWFSDIEQVGIFSAAMVFAMIPELLGTYLAVVFGPRIMPYFRDGRFKRLYRRVQSGCLGIALTLYTLAFVGVGDVAPYLFPASFAASASVLMILLLGTLAAMAAFPLAIPFVMFVRPKFIFYLDLASAPLLAVAYFFAIKAHGAIGAAWVTALSRLIKLGIVQFMAWKWSGGNSSMEAVEWQGSTGNAQNFDGYPNRALSVSVVAATQQLGR